MARAQEGRAEEEKATNTLHLLAAGFLPDNSKHLASEGPPVQLYRQRTFMDMPFSWLLPCLQPIFLRLEGDLPSPDLPLHSFRT